MYTHEVRELQGKRRIQRMDEPFFVTVWLVEVDLLWQSDLSKHAVCSGDLDEEVNEGGSSEREARDQK